MSEFNTDSESQEPTPNKPKQSKPAAKKVAVKQPTKSGATKPKKVAQAKQPGGLTTRSGATKPKKAAPAKQPGSDYEVGYGKTPVRTRYPKGVSGNPNGKRKKLPASVLEGMVGQLLKTVAVTQNGKSKKMAFWDYFLETMCAQVATSTFPEKLLFFTHLKKLGILDEMDKVFFDAAMAAYEPPWTAELEERYQIIEAQFKESENKEAPGDDETAPP